MNRIKTSLLGGTAHQQVAPARRTFLKRLSGGIAAALLALSASNALAGTGTPSVPRWQQVTGPSGVKLKQISVGSASAIWVLDTAGYPWKWTGSGWQKKAGTVSTLSAASDGTLWATNPPDSLRVLKLDLVNNKWTFNLPTGMKQVTAVNATTAWGLDNAGTLFRLNGTTWEKKLGTVSQISVGSDGTLWATHPPASKRMLRWDGTRWNANLPTGMVYVSVGSANNIWALDGSDQVFKWSGSAWQKMPGALRNISAAGDGTVWGINAQGSVYKWVTAAAPAAPAAPTGKILSECPTGPVQCCNSLMRADTPSAAKLLDLLGISADPQTIIGVTCNPISVIGIGGNNCSAQPVCCSGNSFNGIVAIDCVPININM